MSNEKQKQREQGTRAIGDKHFPSLYQSADRASLAAQQRYLCLQKCHIVCLVFGSAAAALATAVSVVDIKWTYTVLAIVVAIGFVLTWVLRLRRDDKVWFDCRAIAESTKTATWRFMMKAAPFKDDRTSYQTFIDLLRRIRKERPFSPHDLAQSLDTKAQSITDSMNIVRQKPFNERQNLYVVSRLRDQKTWYTDKAKFNSRKESCWFWNVLVLQILAVIFAIIRAASSSLPLNTVPLLMTCAAAAIAWIHVKRYSELTQSYSLAAQELGDQETIALNITEEADFLELVEQVEETISREHTMWCVRRDVV